MTMVTEAGETLPRGEPELVVIMSPGGDQAESATPSGAPTTEIDDILSSSGGSIEPLFDGGAGQELAAAVPSPDGGDEGGGEGFGAFFRVRAPEDQLEELASQLQGAAGVEGAYVKPPAEPASVDLIDSGVMLEVAPSTDEAPSTTPNFTSRQDYLDPSPVGIDAAYGWSQPGGGGQGISVIDCEWGWQLTHEDLLQNNLGLVGGSNSSNLSFVNHGTAVFGEIGGDRNSFGVTGISPDAKLGASSFVGQSSANAIKKAADSLSAGDIVLLEIHRGGPNATGAGQKGYIAVEWWPDDFLAIRYAVNKGIVVVEAAGNGWEDLDAAVYDSPASGFPSWWKNPFDLANPSSGAVVVGAGSPPPGTHGRNTSPWNLPYVDRARCGFSNWGSRVDAQGWGWEVTSTGYGNLQGGSDPNRWYTDTFSGTSSASPIVVGALASTQGVLKARGMPLMTSQRARSLLRSTGSPQQSAPGRPVSQRIGNRPNLKQLIPAALRQRIYNTVPVATYAMSSSQAAWVFIKDLGWRRIDTGSPDGVTNVFLIACEAKASGKPVHVDVDATTLYNIWMP